MEINEIDTYFDDYIQKVKPPDNNKEWFDYLKKTFVIAFGFGADYTIKTMNDEIEKAKREESNATNR